MNRVIFLVNCVYGLVVSHEEGSDLLAEGSVFCSVFLLQWKKFT
jgi:hypothetical protein